MGRVKREGESTLVLSFVAISVIVLKFDGRILQGAQTGGARKACKTTFLQTIITASVTIPEITVITNLIPENQNTISAFRNTLGESGSVGFIKSSFAFAGLVDGIIIKIILRKTCETS